MEYGFFPTVIATSDIPHPGDPHPPSFVRVPIAYIPRPPSLGFGFLAIHPSSYLTPLQQLSAIPFLSPFCDMHKSIGSGGPRRIDSRATPTELPPPTTLSSKQSDDKPLLQESVYDDDLSSLGSIYDKSDTRGRGAGPSKRHRIRERSRHAVKKAKVVLDTCVEWMADHEHYVEQPQVIWEYELFKWTMQKVRLTPLVKGAWEKGVVERRVAQREV